MQIMFRKKLQPKQRTGGGKKSIERFCVNCGRPFPNVTLRSRGRVVVKGSFLVAQLEAAFVKS